MEANENISTFICKVKNLRDQLGTIGEKVWDSDLVTITLKCILKDYQVFILSLQLEHNLLHILNCQDRHEQRSIASSKFESHDKKSDGFKNIKLFLSKAALS